MNLEIQFFNGTDQLHSEFNFFMGEVTSSQKVFPNFGGQLKPEAQFSHLRA